FVLLKLRSFDPPRLTLLREGVVRPGEPIRLEDFGEANLWMEIRVKPSFLGRIREFLYKPPKLRLAVWSASSSTKPPRFPGPAPMLAAGFLASPLLLRGSDVMNLYTGASLTRPTAYALEALRGDDSFWSEKIGFRVYKIENEFRKTP